MRYTSDVPTLLTSEVSEKDYHAEAFLPVPALSASTAWTLLTQSPEHAALLHPKFGGASRASSGVQDEGSVLHGLLLGSGAPVVVVDAADWRTKLAREARDEAVARGAIPILEKDHERLTAAAGAIRGRLAEAGITLDGVSEATMAWTAANGVAARGRADHLLGADPGLDLDATAAKVVIVDLKTQARAPGRDKLGADLVRYGGHVQAAAYLTGLQTLRPDWRIDDFLWVVAEREPPFGVTVARPGEDLLELGMKAWEKALTVWARCLETGFSGATRGCFLDPVTVHAPAWAWAGDDE
jgi:hypothetical protein